MWVAAVTCDGHQLSVNSTGLANSIINTCIDRSQLYLRQMMMLPRRKSCSSWLRSLVQRWLTWYSTCDTCSEIVLTAESLSSLRWVLLRVYYPGESITLLLFCLFLLVLNSCILSGVAKMCLLWSVNHRDQSIKTKRHCCVNSTDWQGLGWIFILSVSSVRDRSVIEIRVKLLVGSYVDGLLCTEVPCHCVFSELSNSFLSELLKQTCIVTYVMSESEASCSDVFDYIK